MTRLIVDLTTFYPPHTGGVENFTEAMHTALLSRDATLQIAVVTSNAGATSDDSAASRRSIYRYKALEPVPAFAFAPPWQLLRAVEKGAPAGADLVLSHTRFYPASLMARWVAERTGARWVHIEHGSSYVQSGNALVRVFARVWDHLFGRWVLQHADAVIAISDAVAEFVHELAGVRSIVARRGIEVPSRVHVYREGVAQLLYVGRLVTGKGVHTLVRAHARLEPGPRLVLVGDGDQRGPLEDLAKDLGTSDRVDFLGELPAHGVQEQLAKADVFVNPSLSEGLPTTVLEAAAAGVPVVATAVGGTAEIVEDGLTGFLVPPGTDAALATALDRMIQLPAARRAEMGSAARAKVAAEFNWDLFAATLSDLACD